MRNKLQRNFLPTLILVLIAPVLGVMFFAPQGATAQVLIPPEAIVGQAQLDELISRGEELEQQRRWGEALAHYEQALKDFPGRNDFQQRLKLARAHYDIGRRYADSSYLASIKEMSQQQALDVYIEVLLKIQAHFVHEPNWGDILRCGSLNLSVAFSEPTFLNRHFSDVPEVQLAALGRQLHSTLDERVVHSRQEARDLVAWTARITAEKVGLDPQAVIMEFTCGATAALDEYSSFLTASQLDDVFSQIEGNFVGLGLELKAKDQSLLIVKVIAGSPAEHAGIHKGDRIVAVNGSSTAELTTDAAADLLKGEEGSSVEVTLVDRQKNSRHVRMIRQQIDLPCVEGVKIVDREYGIGYLRLTSFQKTTSRDFDAALWKLHRDGMKSLIVDVRGNPGGLLNASVEVADKFISNGTIVSTRGRSHNEDFDYKAHSVGTWGVPLIVLIDGDSASASEIFAGAIHDHRRGSVVGQRSYGKGSVQGIFPLSTSRLGLRLTTAKFFSPSGQPISHRGVAPDVVVRTVAKPDESRLESVSQEHVDAVLNAGLQVARKQLSQR